MNRVSPPSTGITYTMSADCSPVCGLASTMLSIFTASTGPSDLTGSPVNGSSSGPRCAVGVGLGVGVGVTCVRSGAAATASLDGAGLPLERDGQGDAERGRPPPRRWRPRRSRRGCRATCRRSPLVPRGAWP